MTTQEHNEPLSLAFLGPVGSFTHLAAMQAVPLFRQLGIEVEPRAVEHAREIIEQVERGESLGIIAWDNTVEGVVVPNLDMLMDAQCAGIMRLSVPIAFDALVTPATALACESQPLAQVAHTVHAHPHGLAQCRSFAGKHNLRPVATASNAAACRDLQDGQVALAPSICAQLYNLVPAYKSVQDYDAAQTDFLVIAPRTAAQEWITHIRALDEQQTWESVVACAPLSTGPGVLADLLDTIRDAGLNMTAFMSRPIKGHAGTYSFIITMDAAPWEAACHSVLQEIVEHGDWVKTLGVYPRLSRPDPPVDAWMLPDGGVCTTPARLVVHQQALQQHLAQALLW